MPSVTAARDARQAAATLRLLLDKVKAGELDASPGMVRSLQGSLAALNAMTNGGSDDR